MPQTRTLLFVALLSLAAFALQIHRLEAKSLWTDEGLSVYRARLPLPDALSNQIVIQDVVTTDTHPPFYFVLLHLWRRLAGETEFALRWLSVFMGTLAIPLVYVTGCRIASRGAGVWAAIAGVLSPFVVWYAQDARMYTLLMVEVLLSTYLLLRWIEAPPQNGPPARTRASLLYPLNSPDPRLVGYVVTVVALLLTHYTGILIFAIQSVLLVAVAWRRSRRAAAWVLVAGLIAAVSTVTFVSQRLFSGAEFPARRALEEIVYETWNVFALGPSAAQVRPLEQIAAPVILFIIGLIALTFARRPWHSAFLIAWLLLPVLAFYVISFVKPIYVNPRNVSAGLPALLIGVGTGLASLTGWKRIVLASAVIWLGTWSALAILQIYTDPSLEKDDIRSLARYIEEREQPGDAIVLHDAIIQLTFDYYYGGRLPVQAIPQYAEADVDEAVRQLERVAAQAKRVWFVRAPSPVGFPSRPLRIWARDHMYRIMRQSFAHQYQAVSVDLFATQSPVVAKLPDAARRFEVVPDRLSLAAAQAPATVLGDQWINVQTYWRIGGPVEDSYTVVVDLVDADSQVRGSTREILWRHVPLSEWPEGTIVRWDQPVRVEAGSPPGSYRVQLSSIDAHGRPAQVVNNQNTDAVELGEVKIARPRKAVSVADLNLSRQVNVAFENGMQFIGYSAQDDSLRPGSTVPIDLFWSVERLPAGELDFQLDLRAPDGRTISSAFGRIGGQAFPASTWQTGDLIRTPVYLAVPLEETGGHYSLALSLADAAGRRLTGRSGMWPFSSDEFDVGALTVEEYPLDTSVPEVAYRLDANFGGMIWLRGYDVTVSSNSKLQTPNFKVVPGQTVTVSLVWQAAQRPDRNYTVFLHVVDGEGRLVAQGDSDPVGGLRLTRSWRPGEVIRDDHPIALPDDLPPGNYAMVVGWYDRESPLRLPVETPALSGVEGSSGDSDRLNLEPIRVGE
ncbi:MAG TPA: glycosyltransferase family 39 protein [Anaerolineae bacterium]|nr:glycosyltransferase family 39 protein [Anaerolineae bacterium]